MLVSIPPKYSVASIMGYIKGKSSLMIFDRHAIDPFEKEQKEKERKIKRGIGPLKW